MSVVLRMTGKQHAAIHQHLFPGDGKEAVAILLCGRHRGDTRHCLSVVEVFPVPYEACMIREPDCVNWRTDAIIPALDKATTMNFSVVKIHSHPGGYHAFSWVDDRADRELFPSVYGWTDSDEPHGSAIMLPDGEIFGRVVHESGAFEPFELVSVAGNDIRLWFGDASAPTRGEGMKRTEQTFGTRTTNLLRRLSIAVIGCSGTGGPVLEQLGRYGVGKIVAVDPDVSEAKNLNRIPNTFQADAESATPKVLAHQRAIEAMGFGTVVVPIQKYLSDPEAIRAVADCDIVIGCMDGVEGRHILNRLAATYSVPYFDVGVKLIADGLGGIDKIIGTVHYLQPDGSSLLSRGVYTMDDVRAESLARSNPEAFACLKAEKYIKGVREERPAVVSVNTLFSSLAVLEMLARLYPYRNAPNRKFAVYRLDLTEGFIDHESETQRCLVASKYLGRGDLKPLLGYPGIPYLTKP